MRWRSKMATAAKNLRTMDSVSKVQGMLKTDERRIEE